MSRDIYSEITKAILSELDNGTVPWRKPWVHWGDEFGQRNLQSGKAYRGINQILTAMRANAEGWDKPFWTTFKACQKAGGKVRKGEKGQLVTFWRNVEVEDKDNPGHKRKVFLLRHYIVFNVAQCDGLDVPEAPAIEVEAVPAIDTAEQIIGAMADSPSIRLGGNQAFYIPTRDHVQLPDRDQFRSADAYYHTAFHELAHSTGHEKRLGRDGIMERHCFGDDDYSREELVAELGASMVAGVSGIDPEIPQSAAYIEGWRRKLRGDKKLIVKAAGQAQKAADRILGVSFAA